MLKVYDQNHEPVGALIKYQDLKIESDLATGDKKMTFSVNGAPNVEIHAQYFLRTQTDEFVVKRIEGNSRRSKVPYEAVLNLEDLVGKPFKSFSIYKKSMRDAITEAIDGTGWTLGLCDIPDEDVRNAGKAECDALSVILDLCAVWMADPEFDTLNKRVNIYKERGEDKGCYFASGLNLRNVKRLEESNDFYTVIIPEGANDLDISSVNEGIDYLTDFSYSRLWKAYRWVDETYTEPEDLKKDAQEYLKELARPKTSLTCEVIDLARQKSMYSVLSYGLGDYVKIIDPGTRIREKQRITKIVEYPASPWKNECEMANHQLRFTEMLEKRKKAHDIEVFEGADGVVSLSTILKELKNK